MGITADHRMPNVDPGPTPNELINEIFAEAGRQKITLINLSKIIDWDVQKLGRVKRGGYIPKIDEYMNLCRAVGKTPRQIEDRATRVRAILQETS